LIDPPILSACYSFVIDFVSAFVRCLLTFPPPALSLPPQLTGRQGPIFSNEEKAAFADVKKALLAADVRSSELNDVALITVTMLSKLVVDKSVDKYKSLLTTIEEYDLTMVCTKLGVSQS